MALSFCSNWESLQQLDSTMLSFQDQQQAQVLLPQNDSSCCFEFPDTSIDPFLSTDELFYTDNSFSNLLPYLSSSTSDALFSPEIFPLEEDFESISYQLLPKRQKSYYHYDSSSNFATNYFYGGGYWENSPLVPEIIPAPVVATSSKVDESVVKKPSKSGGSLSAQSIAARERRRKITEKTQELGKLIPGGHRMNTAEMFQAASKYVKFLQAQVKLLQLMELKQEIEEPFHAQELLNLLASPIMQEKLYSEEKCLVPKEFVETLAKEPEIQSKPTVFEGIDQLLNSNGQSWLI